MIETFKDKKIENFLKRGNAQGIPPNFLKKIKLRLDVIDAATHIEQIRLPGYDLHELSGDRQGTWSIKVSGNWRITFRFIENNAYDVQMEDYH